MHLKHKFKKKYNCWSFKKRNLIHQSMTKNIIFTLVRDYGGINHSRKDHSVMLCKFYTIWHKFIFRIKIVQTWLTIIVLPYCHLYYKIRKDIDKKDHLWLKLPIRKALLRHHIWKKHWVYSTHKDSGRALQLILSCPSTSKGI